MGGREIGLAADFRDLLRAFVAHDVRFLVVGAYALAIHGRPRATGDLDLWIDATPANARRTHVALSVFGAPVRDLDVVDLAAPGVVFQIGLPPLRIDVLTAVSGVRFVDAWRRRVRAVFEGVPVWVIGAKDFVTNKRATGRLKDLADIEGIGRPTSAVKPSRRRKPSPRR